LLTIGLLALPDSLTGLLALLRLSFSPLALCPRGRLAGLPLLPGLRLCLSLAGPLLPCLTNGFPLCLFLAARFRPGRLACPITPSFGVPSGLTLTICLLRFAPLFDLPGLGPGSGHMLLLDRRWWPPLCTLRTGAFPA
jgi:hypothetical protein